VFRDPGLEVPDPFPKVLERLEDDTTLSQLGVKKQGRANRPEWVRNMARSRLQAVPDLQFMGKNKMISPKKRFPPSFYQDYMFTILF
jgi:hypothetical protein